MECPSGTGLSMYKLTKLYLGLAGAVEKNFNQAHSEGDCQNER